MASRSSNRAELRVPRRWSVLSSVLIGGAIVTAITSIMILVAMINEGRTKRTEFRGNLSHYATQLDYELLQFIDRIERFVGRDPTVSRADILVHLDVVWSRIPQEAGGGQFANYLNLPGASAVLTELRSRLELIEPQLETLERTEIETAQAIVQQLRKLVRKTHDLTMEAIRFDAVNESDHLAGDIRLGQTLIGLIVGMVAFSLLSLAYALMERRRYRSLNVMLEHVIAERTEALTEANEKLSHEVEERRIAQEELALREERLEMAARLAKLGHYVWDAVNDRCLYCSEQHARAHGLSPEEFIAKASIVDGPMSLVHPEDREKVRDAYKALRSGELIDFEHRVVTPAGTRVLREIGRPVFDEKGRVIREVGSALDITEYKETERKLFAAQRLEAIGQLSGGIAHDFNNILAVVLGNLELIGEAEDPEEIAQFVEASIASCLRARELTKNLLAFARRSMLDPERSTLNAVIGEFESIARRVLPPNISIKTSLTAEPWPVFIDRSALESALLNLSINARDAMPDGGKLTLETSNVQIDEAYLSERGEEAPAGRYVMIAVTDTGIGMEKEVLKRIFEPFYSTKRVGQGSGLGLPMVDGFVRQSRGFVQVYSEVGIGTAFKMYFPTAEDSATEEPMAVEQKDSELQTQRSARILLVEDEEQVRNVLARGLRRAGFTVVDASDGTAAEKEFLRSGPFDLLVTDIAMPGDLQGPALANKLREHDPKLPVIFLSGYPKEASVHGNGLRPEDVRMMKPVRRAELLATIRDQLGMADTTSRLS